MIISGINLSGVSFSSYVGPPDAPTIGTATSTGGTTATVDFTAPANNNGSTITSYTAVSSPGNITGSVSQSGSGTITISGLTSATSYTFTVYATNALGNGQSSSASNSITTPAIGQVLFDYTGIGTANPGTGINYYYSSSTWTVPAGVTSISVVCIGAGAPGIYHDTYVVPVGGAGGSLAYENNISVTPGETLTITYGPGTRATSNPSTTNLFGSNSTLWRGTPFATNSVLLCGAGGGPRGSNSGSGAAVQGNQPANGGQAFIPGTGANPSLRSASSGTTATGGWGFGGRAGYGSYSATAFNPGGGGAGGYVGSGGSGGYQGGVFAAAAGAGGGGGGGGYASTTGNIGSGGGGTSPYGQGTNGAAGSSGSTSTIGGGYSAAVYTAGGGLYGGGGGTAPVATWSGDSNALSGGRGCVRIIWPGTTRQFPSTNTADM